MKTWSRENGKDPKDKKKKGKSTGPKTTSDPGTNAGSIWRNGP